MQLVEGPRRWSLSTDAEGWRTYKVTHLVKGTGREGPASARVCPGLPVEGAPWAFLDDYDPWVWCLPNNEVTPAPGVQEHGPGEYFHVEQTFSNKPSNARQRDPANPTEDPLLEPQKVSGDFVRISEEAAYDKDGNRLCYSSFEPIRGSQIEFDKSRVSITVEQNVAILNLPLIAAMIDTVNSAPLWGLPARFWKLVSAPWKRQFHGQSERYYTRTFTFEAWIRMDPDTGLAMSGWDRKILDQSSMALNGLNINGHWVIQRFADGSLPDPSKPTHFVRYKDKNGDYAETFLNGFGVPVDLGDTGTANDEIGVINVQVYNESNFLLLGIPLVF